MAIWLTLLILVAFSVFLVNGRVLFYFDSPAYISQGAKILTQLGLMSAEAGNGTGGGFGQAEGDNVVSGSRAAVYSLVAAIIRQLGGLSLFPIANFMVILFSVWLPVRILLRTAAPKWSQTTLTLLPLLAAMAGSLPFYIAYVMPDILTGVLLLMIATITVLHRQMTVWELLLSTALGAFSVVSHLSHIPIAAAMVPVSAIVALIFGRTRWWVPPLLIGLMVVAGAGERAAFKVAAKKVSNAEVRYIPFLTARLIQDGPGWKYLQAKCPDEGLKTCALFDALSKSDDDYRFTASHIIFETSERLGSFRLMTKDDQGRVAREQYRFFVKVLLWAPVSTTAAIVKNTFVQAGMNDVRMTIPSEKILENVKADYPALGDFAQGRLSRDRAWLDPVEAVHSIVYGASLAVILLFLVLPGRLPLVLKGFGVMVLLGILDNAFVTGALSQPADRYGARVVWLLPFTAMLMGLYAFGNWKQVVQDDT